MGRKTVLYTLLALLISALPALAAEPQPFITVVRTVPTNAPEKCYFRFSLWNAPTGPELVFLEQKKIALKDRTLTHRLGSVNPELNPLPLAAFAEQLYLKVEYFDDEGHWQGLGAREMLAVVPYAITTLVPLTGGAPGPAGKDGLPGEPGPPGQDGKPGASCWDRDQDALCDPAEDVNKDGSCTVADCLQPQGAVGTGTACSDQETLIWHDGGWHCAPFPQQGCTAGDLKSCYEGDPKTLNVGRCRPGVNVCGDDGSWGPCVQQVLPALEVCEPGAAQLGTAFAALLDDDCDGVWNVADAPGCVPVYPDADGDGIGAIAGARCFCAPTPAFPAAVSGDCDDNDAAVKGPTTTYWLDADQDGHRDCAARPKALCAPAAPYTATENANCDCDDTVAANPALLSSRGFTTVNRGKDADHDGFGDCKTPLGWFCPGNDYTAPGYLSLSGDTTDLSHCDCDDTTPNVIGPGYYCKDADSDRAGAESATIDGYGEGRSLCAPVPPYNTLCADITGPDCDDSNPAMQGEFYCKDVDSDGFRAADESGPGACMMLCAPFAPYTVPFTVSQDCDDNDPARTLVQTWYPDADGDGFGSTTIVFQGCGSDAEFPGAVHNAKDCDDTNPDPNKVKTEWCRDADGDGYRGMCPPGYYCTAPNAGYPLPKSAPLDCNDADPLVPAVNSCP
jgi:hypothetical protein